MKKVFFALACVFAFFATTLTVKADNERALPIAQFPQTAQQFIKQHFADQKVVISKVETDFLEKVYVVIFSNGNSVEFYRDGEWKEIECKYSQVPAAAVPSFIQKYVTENYPDAKIVSVDKDKSDKEYDVKLSSRWELKFDYKGNLIDLEND